jgi:hypothetical protein
MKTTTSDEVIPRRQDALVMKGGRLSTLDSQNPTAKRHSLGRGRELRVTAQACDLALACLCVSEARERQSRWL